MKSYIIICVLIVVASQVYANDERKSETEPIELKKAVLVGGQENIDSSDPIVQELTGFINSHRYNSTGVDENIWLVSGVANVTSQVVSGVIYRMDVTLTKTTCLKEETLVKRIKIDDLKVSENSLCAYETSDKLNNTVTINYQILTKPWLDSVEILSEKEV